MYAQMPTYGYGPGNNQQASFNPNGTPFQPNPHQQQPGQQPQPMMYNPQQFAGAHSSPYGAAGPGMGPNAGGMGMMQNNGMAQMAGPQVSQYQTPYSGSPYGGNIPVSASNLPPNFMPTSNAPPFQMNPANMNMNMNPQQMQHMQSMQRMQPPPSSTPTQPGPQASPFAGAHNNTPPNAGSAQSQFSTPPNSNQTQSQTPNNIQQSHGGTVVTPQTPNFPPGPQSAGGIGNMATPLSPGSEIREKERVTLLLDINRELLLEVMRLQAAQAESKKEESSPATSSPDGGERDKAEKEKADKTKALSGREYVECMRRLQSNLAYLAAIADRSHKPSSQIPPHPAIMTAPPLIAKPPQPSSLTNSPSADTKKEESDEKKTDEPEGDRVEVLKQQYKKLQDLFPGVDPKREPPLQSGNTAARAQQQAQMQKHQQQGQGQGQGPDPNAQQKMQNDMLRQRMMQQAQAQAQQQMAQGMQGQQQQGQG